MHERGLSPSADRAGREPVRGTARAERGMRDNGDGERSERAMDRPEVMTTSPSDGRWPTMSDLRAARARKHVVASDEDIINHIPFDLAGLDISTSTRVLPRRGDHRATLSVPAMAEACVCSVLRGGPMCVRICLRVPTFRRPSTEAAYSIFQSRALFFGVMSELPR